MSRGFTMLEMIVALSLLGLLVGVASLAFRSLDPPAASLTVRELQATRDSAIAKGESLIWTHEADTVRFEPDGSSSGGEVTAEGTTYLIDPVTGAIRERR